MNQYGQLLQRASGFVYGCVNKRPLSAEQSAFHTFHSKLHNYDGISRRIARQDPICVRTICSPQWVVVAQPAPMQVQHQHHHYTMRVEIVGIEVVVVVVVRRRR